jgi:hypothetical protein
MAKPNKKLRLGIVGMSDGNGHPYSWSAICNGYDKNYMGSCPFPIIPEYLSKQKYPDDFLSEFAEVTHIWTQQLSISNHIAKSSKIDFVVNEMEDLIGQVDAILLARDDGENHLRMALPFLRAGLPIFIDKPLALTVKDANSLLESQLYDGQLFSCSSLRYADELIFSKEDHEQMEEIIYIEATVPKSWEKYAIHLLEPIISSTPERGKLIKVDAQKFGDIVKADIKWEYLNATVRTYGKYDMPLQITYFTKNGKFVKQLSNTFLAFKKSITTFINQVEEKRSLIPRAETLEIIKIIESGNYA